MLDLPISEPHQLHLAIQDSRAHKKSSSRMKSNIYIGNLVSRNILYTGQLIGLMDNLLFLKNPIYSNLYKIVDLQPYIKENLRFLNCIPGS